MSQSKQKLHPNFSNIPLDQSLESHRRRLPHWEQRGRVYFLTFRLFDSIPQQKVKQIKSEKEQWLRCHPKPWKPEELKEYYQRFEGEYQRWLDSGYGACIFRNVKNRALMESSLLHFDTARYVLDQYVIMPNHVHLLVMAMEGFSMEKLVHTWKSYSANEINKKLTRKGTLWMQEYFDHIVRSKAQLIKFRDYVLQNPIKAKLKANEYTLGKGSGILEQ